MHGFGSLDMGYTDHRMLWIDIDTDSLLGYQPPPLAPIQQIGIPLQDPAIANRYNNSLRKARHTLNIPNQIFWLEQRALKGEFDEYDAQLFKHLITQDDKLRDNCKAKLRKKYAGNVLYSDVIRKDRKTIQLWKLIQKRIQNQRIDTPKIGRLMKIFNKPTALRMNPNEVDTAEQNCRKRYSKHKKDDKAIRKAFQLQVNERRAKKYKTSIEAQEKVTRNAFKSKTAFRHINPVLQKKERTAITFVESTDTHGVLHESTNNDTIFKACSQEDTARYGQCADTPFMQSPLCDDFGYLGNQKAIEEVLDGLYQCHASQHT
jgi:hypothetical protein